MKKILAIIGGVAALSAVAIAPAAFAGSGDSSVIGGPTPVAVSSMTIGNMATTAAGGAPTVSGVVITTPATTKASAAVLAGRSECGDGC
jgi:hypothetical protein